MFDHWKKELSELSPQEIFRLGQLSATFAAAYASYKVRGRTPDKGYWAMRELHPLTQGGFGRNFSRILGMVHPPKHNGTRTEVLGPLSDASLEEILRGLRKDGYARAPFSLSEDMVERLTAWALETPSEPIDPKSMDDAYNAGFVGLERQPYNRESPASFQQWFGQPTVAQNKDIQRLMMEEAVLKVVRAHLGCEPIYSILQMWWSNALGGGKASSAGGQIFHYDMDRVRFLNVFFYLTDVDTNTGPHVYVRRSHRKIPPPLRRDGRLHEDEIAAHYDPADVVELLGKKGSVLFVDTSGFHRGKPPVEKDRLILQFSFAISLFGTDYAKLELPGDCLPEFHAFAKKNPRLFSCLQKKP
jgi:hypothetical protein